MGTLIRRSITPPGLEHGDNPIPAACRYGPLLATSRVRGVDPATGEQPDAVDAQVTHMFANMDTILADGGGCWGNIVKMTFWIAEPAARPLINAAWVARFPNPESRPARQVINSPLGHGMLVQCDALAFIEPEAGHG